MQFRRKKVKIICHRVGFFAGIYAKLTSRIQCVVISEFSYMLKDGSPVDIRPFTFEDISRLAYYLSDRISLLTGSKEARRSDTLHVLETYAYYRINLEIHKILAWVVVMDNLSSPYDRHIIIEREVWAESLDKELNNTSLFKVNISFMPLSFLDSLDVRVANIVARVWSSFSSKADENINMLTLPERVKSSEFCLDIGSEATGNNVVGISISGSLSAYCRNDISGLELTARDYKLLSFEAPAHNDNVDKTSPVLEQIIDASSKPGIFSNPIIYVKVLWSIRVAFSKVRRVAQEHGVLSKLGALYYKKYCKEVAGFYYYLFQKNKIQTLLLSDYMDPMFCKLFAISLVGGRSVYYDRSIGYCFPDFTYIVPSNARCYSNQYERDIVPIKDELQVPISIGFREQSSRAEKYLQSLLLPHRKKHLVSIFDESLDAVVYDQFIQGVITAVKTMPDTIFLFKPKKLEKIKQINQSQKDVFNKLAQEYRIMIIDPCIRSVDLISISDLIVTLPSTVYFEATKMKKTALVYDHYGVMSRYFDSREYCTQNIYLKMECLVKSLQNIATLKFVPNPPISNALQSGKIGLSDFDAFLDSRVNVKKV